METPKNIHNAPLVLMAMLFLPAMIAATPTFGRVAQVNDPNTEFSSPDLSLVSEAVPRSLEKRHDYYVLCGQYLQDTNPKTPFEWQSDIKLSRKCVGSPYIYTCKEDGENFHQGSENWECSHHCKCRKRPTYSSPLCLVLGSSAGATICKGV